jgi:hypothetical protein
MPSKETQYSLVRTCQYCGSEVEPSTKVCPNCAGKGFDIKRRSVTATSTTEQKEPHLNTSTESPKNDHDWLRMSLAGLGGFMGSTAFIQIVKILDNPSLVEPIIDPSIDVQLALLINVLALLVSFYAVATAMSKPAK